MARGVSHTDTLEAVAAGEGQPIARRRGGEVITVRSHCSRRPRQGRISSWLPRSSDRPGRTGRAIQGLPTRTRLLCCSMPYRSLGERGSQQRLREVRRVAVPRSLARQHQPSATAAERASVPGLPPRIRCGRTGRPLACNSLRVAATRTKSLPLSSSPRLAPKLRPSPDSCAPSPFPRALPPVSPKYRCVCSVSRPRVCTVHGSPPPIQIGLTARASSTMTCLPASSLGRFSDRHTLEANQRLVFAPENRRSPFSRNARSPRANHPGRAERRGGLRSSRPLAMSTPITSYQTVTCAQPHNWMP